MTSLDVALRKWQMAMDLRIARKFENLKNDIDLRMGGRVENLKKGHRSGCRDVSALGIGYGFED